MKKGIKLSEFNYELTISDLNRKPVLTSTATSLRDLVNQVADIIPDMDTHSKVYRQMRENLGVYMGLFVVAGKKKYRHIMVTITTDVVSEADIARFHARAATLPTGSLPDDF
jgi:hypothetical protein